MLARMTASAAIVAALMSLLPASTPATASPVPAIHSTTVYKYAQVDGIKIFYREAGPAHAPTRCSVAARATGTAQRSHAHLGVCPVQRLELDSRTGPKSHAAKGSLGVGWAYTRLGPAT